MFDTSALYMSRCTLSQSPSKLPDAINELYACSNTTAVCLCSLAGAGQSLHMLPCLAGVSMKNFLLWTAFHLCMELQA